MLVFRRCTNLVLLVLLLNSFVFMDMFGATWPIRIVVLSLLLFFYVYFLIRPRGDQPPEKKLRTLIYGYELIWTAEVLACVQIVLYLACRLLPFISLNIELLVFSVAFCFPLLWVMLLDGIIRLFISSRQIGLLLRISLVVFWWVPLLNLILLNKVLRIVQEEFSLSIFKHRRNLSREGTAYCATKYPLILIHGIFFRDWDRISYWGRIPKALTQNEAVVYYGNQQSSASLMDSASELAKRIREVLEETGAEKVNIIAHSKGGLDARYAISCLGMGQYVASLTTINTPHRGSVLAEKLIQIAPDKFVLAVGKKYDALYAKLGDEQPDFFSGVSDLTEARCETLNEIMIDDPRVYYQSVGSKMRTRFSAPFPLNAGYSLIEPLRGDNDGLVATDSMAWGHFLGVYSTTGKRGISHCDMIDLWRKDISGFDVCEFYVSLVHQLKEKGM